MFATTASEAYSHRGVDNNALTAVQFVSARVASFGFTTTTATATTTTTAATTATATTTATAATATTTATTTTTTTKKKKTREYIEGFWRLRALYNLMKNGQRANTHIQINGM